MSGRAPEDVQVVVSPYQICPLGAHIDHQGGTVSAMTINKGILLGFVPSSDGKVHLCSEQFKGEVRFSVDEIQQPLLSHPRGTNEKNPTDCSALGERCSDPKKEQSCWGNYARGAQYALQSRGHELSKGMTGYICGSEGLDSSGLSSSAAVGVAYLLAFENANNISISPTENIEYDRLIENEYLGLRNGILDQSAILLSRHGCLAYMNCKTKEHRLIHPPDDGLEFQKNFRILLAFSGLKQALTTNPGYNRRVEESREAARVLLHASGDSETEPVLSNVDPKVYEAHKELLEFDLAKRAEHYFSETERVQKGFEAWTAGDLDEFGSLITASGLSSIKNYECGAEPLIQLYEVLVKAPGIHGARFSGAGFRGCCIAFVETEKAAEAVPFIKEEYSKCQPEQWSCLNPRTAVLICEAGDCAQVL